MTDPCNDGECAASAVNCVLASWGSFSKCDKTCGDGTQTRTRKIITEPTLNGTACSATEETQICNLGECDTTETEETDATDEGGGFGAGEIGAVSGGVVVAALVGFNLNRDEEDMTPPRRPASQRLKDNEEKPDEMHLKF